MNHPRRLIKHQFKRFKRKIAYLSPRDFLPVKSKKSWVEFICFLIKFTRRTKLK